MSVDANPPHGKPLPTTVGEDRPGYQACRTLSHGAPSGIPVERPAATRIWASDSSLLRLGGTVVIRFARSGTPPRSVLPGFSRYGRVHAFPWRDRSRCPQD